MQNLTNLQLINTNAPRETLVYLSKDGKKVIKAPVSNNNKQRLQTWLGKQKIAKSVSDGVLKFNNSTYKIPRTLKIYDEDFIVEEERVVGTPLKTSFVESLEPKELDIIYKSFANFLNDINQSRPVLKQKDFFDAVSGEKDMTLGEVLLKLQEHIPSEELTIVRQAKDWFDVTSDNDASVVFSHGDMNENNIFFNKETKTLSVIDFADSKYQNADYMFNVDLARLGWLDIDRLIKEYEKLPKKQNVNIKSSQNVKDMRTALYNFKSSAIEFLKNPKLVPQIRITLIRNDITKIKNYLEKIEGSKKFEKAKQKVILEGNLKANTALKNNAMSKVK